MTDESKHEMIAGKERLLCYAGTILGSFLANSTAIHDLSVPNWLIQRSVEAAQRLIDEVYKS